MLDQFEFLDYYVTSCFSVSHQPLSDSSTYILEILNVIAGNRQQLCRIKNPEPDSPTIPSPDSSKSAPIKFSSIVTKPTFGQLIWSPNNQYLAFMVEKQSPSSKNFTDVENDADFATAGHKFDWAESWGEQLQDNFRSILAVYDLENESVSCYDYSEDYALSNPVFTENNDLLLIAENVRPFKGSNKYFIISINFLSLSSHVTLSFLFLFSIIFFSQRLGLFPLSHFFLLLYFYVMFINVCYPLFLSKLDNKKSNPK